MRGHATGVRGRGDDKSRRRGRLRQGGKRGCAQTSVERRVAGTPTVHHRIQYWAYPLTEGSRRLLVEQVRRSCTVLPGSVCVTANWAARVRGVLDLAIIEPLSSHIHLASDGRLELGVGTRLPVVAHLFFFQPCRPSITQTWSCAASSRASQSGDCVRGVRFAASLMSMHFFLVPRWCCWLLVC